MKTIYERAEEAVVWQGPSELYGHRDSVEEINRKLRQTQAKDSLLALANWLRHGYWWRMWIVQELTVAKHITLYCGTESILVEAIDEVQRPHPVST